MPVHMHPHVNNTVMTHCILLHWSSSCHFTKLIATKLLILFCQFYESFGTLRHDCCYVILSEWSSRYLIWLYYSRKYVVLQFPQDPSNKLFSRLLFNFLKSGNSGGKEKRKSKNERRTFSCITRIYPGMEAGWRIILSRMHGRDSSADGRSAGKMSGSSDMRHWLSNFKVSFRSRVRPAARNHSKLREKKNRVKESTVGPESVPSH